MAPKEDGNVSNCEVDVRSRRVFGQPSRGAEPCKEVRDDVEWAENDGEAEKNGCQELAIVGRCSKER